MLLKTRIGDAEVKLIFIIVPKLIRDCILGYDALNNLKMFNYTVHKKILFETDEQEYKVNYTTASLDQETYESMHLQYSVDNVIIETQEKKTPETEITYEEITEKINKCAKLDGNQRTRLIN